KYQLYILGVSFCSCFFHCNLICYCTLFPNNTVGENKLHRSQRTLSTDCENHPSIHGSGFHPPRDSVFHCFQYFIQPHFHWRCFRTMTACQYSDVPLILCFSVLPKIIVSAVD
ncbi:T. brucei spp.-specific protein, partial [Trypanosoma brucei gambiense DAL972]